MKTQVCFYDSMPVFTQTVKLKSKQVKGSGHKDHQTSQTTGSNPTLIGKNVHIYISDDTLHCVMMQSVSLATEISVVSSFVQSA